MARLNTRPSTLSTTSSRYRSVTPVPHYDQENVDPEAPQTRDKTAMADVHQPAPVISPTPPSADDHSEAQRGQKRKRSAITAATRAHTDDVNEEEEEFTKYYDPYQEPGQRREVRKRVRELDRDFRDRRDELLQDDGPALADTVKGADALFSKVKQTGDATLDSRLLVDVSDLAYKRSAALVLGSNSTGLDIDEFLAKVVSYMRNHGPIQAESAHQSSLPQQRQRPADRDGDGDDEDEDADDEITNTVPLDWEFLGRNACYPHNVRPPVRSFLLGPLSLEKKQRAQTQRRARNARDANVYEAKPQAITRDDLTNNDAASLTSQCAAIMKQLKKHVKTAVSALRDAGITSEDIGTERGRKMMRKLRLAHVDGTAGPPLLEYVINPHSFGQTVENVFYASFLIKEGSAGIGFDPDGLPVLCKWFPCSRRKR